MKVEKFFCRNFRNIEEAEITAHGGTNVIYGQNAQGKTNLVEAVMLNALTKSPRTSHDEDMKKENTQFTEAELCVHRDFGDVVLKCQISNEDGKVFFVNSNEIKKVSDYIDSN